MRRTVLRAAAAVLGACTAHPPARWAQGGADLEIPHARWTLNDGATELLPDGRVQVNAEHLFTIDAAGRIFDPDANPIALLEPDGRLVGPDDVPLGFVGSQSASPPGSQEAWISLQPSGELIAYDADGHPMSLGGWVGQCGATPRTRQVCVLVSHLMVLRMRQQARSGPTVGAGVGVGMGRGGFGFGAGFGLGFGTRIPIGR